MSEPRIIEVPGIPGKLREQTLDEYMGALPATHLAREQLQDIRDMALQGMKAVNELLESQKKIRELESQLSAKSVPAQLQEPVTTAGNPVSPIQTVSSTAPQTPAFPKAKCPNCEMRVSTSPGAWASHQKAKHNLTQVPIPKE